MTPASYPDSPPGRDERRRSGSAPWATIVRVRRVASGLDVLVRRRAALLRGKRFALLAHQASVDGRLQHAVTLLADLPGARLARLFAPEHGLWGAAQDHARVGRSRDPVTGLPVESLTARAPPPPPRRFTLLTCCPVDRK